MKILLVMLFLFTSCDMVLSESQLRELCKNLPPVTPTPITTPVDDCTKYDTDTGELCADGYYNCDCLSHCGATSPCGVTPTPTPGEGTVEKADYHGRYNGDRATWYLSKKMSSYPKDFTVVVSACKTFEVKDNNGTRFEYGGYIIKQSDVAGRGMAIVAPASCKSTEAYVKF